MTTRRDVVFWYSALSPYMADRFSALAEAGTVNFECWFNRLRNTGRSWIVPPGRVRFPHRFVPSPGLNGLSVGVPIRAAIAARPRLVISFHADLAVAPSILWSLPGGRLAYYVERTFDTWTPRSAMKERAKRILFSRADAFFTPGPDADAYLHRYAVPQSNIFRLEHVVDVEHFDDAARLRRSSELVAQRRRLGLQGVVFLYVGRISWQKGLTTLLDAYAAVRSQRPDCSLLIVGDGDERDRYVAYAREQGIPGVIFHDFVQQEALPAIYALGDVFVFPTRGDPYGLVVDEAMASSLPIISTRMAGEITQRVRPGQTGWLVAHDSVEELAKAMSESLSDGTTRAHMGSLGREYVTGRSTSRWVHQLEHAVSAILGAT